MLTLEQVLNNNTIEEGVRIIISSVEQYKEFIIFLDKNNYIWRGSRKRLVDYCPFGDFEELTEFCLPLNFMFFSLHKDTTVTYGEFFTLNGFDEKYFCESCDKFFTHEKEVLYKPYAYLKREIAQCTGIEEW